MPEPRRRVNLLRFASLAPHVFSHVLALSHGALHLVYNTIPMRFWLRTRLQHAAWAGSVTTSMCRVPRCGDSLGTTIVPYPLILSTFLPAHAGGAAVEAQYVAALACP
jgi:hypothetical protein